MYGVEREAEIPDLTDDNSSSPRNGVESDFSTFDIVKATQV